MSDLHEYTGVVEDIEQKGRGPLRFALGTDSGQFHNQKKFQVWQTDYETKQPNPACEAVQALVGQTVTVRYSTKEETYNGKTFPKNTVHEVVHPQPAPQAAPQEAAPPQAEPATQTVSVSDLVTLTSTFEAQLNEAFRQFQDLKQAVNDHAWNNQ